MKNSRYLRLSLPVCAITFALLLLASFMTACNDSSNKGEGHHHDDNLHLAAYSQEMEIYAEATPLSVGHPSEITAHFTRIPSFKPMEAGVVTATLKVGSQEVSQTLDKTDRQGVYKFKLTPKTEGEGSLIFVINERGRESKLTVAGVKVYKTEHAAAHAASDQAITSSNALAFSKEMSWKMDFATSEVELTPMGQLIHVMGRIQPSSGSSRTLTARNPGTVRFNVDGLTEGSEVAAGQTLFTIDGSSTVTGNLSLALSQAESDYNASLKELKRVTELRRQKLATESEEIKARNDFEKARETFRNLKSSLSSGAGSVTAPIGGFITSVTVQNGQYVESGAPLATVAQTRDLMVKADIQPSYAPLLQQIGGITITIPSSGETLSLSDAGGAVNSVGQAVDAVNPLIPLTLKVPNRNGLTPGTWVDLYISAGQSKPVVAVPRTALVEEMGNYFVYVQLHPEYFEKREVKTGRFDGENYEVLSGLKPGERIVSRGATLVKLAHASGALDPHAGHMH